MYDDFPKWVFVDSDWNALKDPNKVAYLRSTFAESPTGAVIRVCPSSSTAGGLSFLL